MVRSSCDDAPKETQSLSAVACAASARRPSSLVDMLPFQPRQAYAKAILGYLAVAKFLRAVTLAKSLWGPIEREYNSRQWVLSELLFCRTPPPNPPPFPFLDSDWPKLHEALLTRLL